VSDHLYRIVQEAVTNAARHASAKRLIISVTASKAALVLEVTDDGIGIAQGYKPGFGLHSMRYRADAIGAQLVIAAIAPHGTRVQVRLPLTA
jgi:signal transduction histidine kinase